MTKDTQNMKIEGTEIEHVFPGNYHRTVATMVEGLRLQFSFPKISRKIKMSLTTQSKSYLLAAGRLCKAALEIKIFSYFIFSLLLPKFSF